MLGAIAGDIIGSVYEFNPIKTKNFPLFTEHSVFTDDTVLTVAIAEAVMRGGGTPEIYARCLKEYGRKYPNAGYGMLFARWLFSEREYRNNSWGNGAIMRISPIGFAFNSPETIMKEAEMATVPSHNHPEAIKAARCIAVTVYLARTGYTKREIAEYITTNFGYNLDTCLSRIRKYYNFDGSARRTVLPSVRAFLESDSFEDAIRNAVSLGIDADTVASVTGAIAHAYYGDIPRYIAENIKKRLDRILLVTVNRFCRRFGIEFE